MEETLAFITRLPKEEEEEAEEEEQQTLCPHFSQKGGIIWENNTRSALLSIFFSQTVQFS